MQTFVAYLLAGLSWVLSAGAIVALIVASTGRWSSVQTLARRLTIGLAIYAIILPIYVIVGLTLIANGDAASKATLLARGISEVMNCAAIASPSLIAPVLWWIASRRSIP